MLGALPLLAIVVAAYSLFALTAPASLLLAVVSLQLVSGATWVLSLAELLAAIGLVLLFVEIAKATRTTASSVVDHMLSMAVFVVALLEFLLLAPFGSAAFFLIVLMCLIDVIAGFTVTISSARRDVAFER